MEKKYNMYYLSMPVKVSFFLFLDVIILVIRLFMGFIIRRQYA